MTKEIVTILLSAILAFVVWLMQRLRTRVRLRFQIQRDIRSWRKTLLAMEGFFEKHKERIENEGNVKVFFFEHSRFVVYENIVSQLNLLSNKEIEAVSSFYEWYRTFEHEIVAFADTLKRLEVHLKEGGSLSNDQIAFSIFNVHRILVLKQLLLESSDYAKLTKYKDNYEYQFTKRLEPFQESLLKTYDVKVW